MSVDPAHTGDPITALALNVKMGGIAVVAKCGISPGVTWEESPERTGIGGVSLLFSSFGNSEEHGMVEVQLVIENEVGFATGYKVSPEVDYFQDGKWYTVYSGHRRDYLIPSFFPAVMQIHEPGERECSFFIAEEAFQRPGKYRLSLAGEATIYDTIATCTLEIESQP